MLSIVVHHFLPYCSIFRTIDPGVDSFDQTVLTIVALMALLRSMWTLLNQKYAMIQSALQQMPMNIVEWAVVRYFAAANNKEKK